MAFNFPDAPTLNQVFQSYTWDSEKWISTIGGIAKPITVTPPSVVAWDPLTSSSTVLSNGFLTGLSAGGNGYHGMHVAASEAKTTGKYYFEQAYTTVTGGDNGVGVGTPDSTFNNMGNAASVGAMVYQATGNIYNGINTGISLGAFTAGQVAGIAVDLDNRKIWFRRAPSGNWNNNASYDPATNTGGITLSAGEMIPWNTFQANGNIFTANFGATAFTGAVPSGFTSGWPLNSPITPADLAGLIGWWDASIFASLGLAGTDVNSWADQSGGGRTLNQDTISGGKPQYSATSFNSTKPGITLSTSGQSGFNRGSFPMGTGNTATIFFVGSMFNSSSDAGARAMDYFITSNFDYDDVRAWALLRNGSTATGLGFIRNSQSALGTTAAYPAPHRLIVTVNSSGLMTFYIDGVSVGTATSAGNWGTGGQIQIGRDHSGVNSIWRGVVAEAGVATGFSNAATVAQLDKYLAAKWGLPRTGYGNPGGIGDRTASITVTTNITAGNGNVTMLVNGNFSNQYWINAGQSARTITFDFGVGASKFINEFRWIQSASGAQGTWVFGGSNDTVVYTEFPESFAIGATGTTTCPVSNTAGYRYYRLRQTAGTTTDGPYLLEVEFKIA